MVPLCYAARGKGRKSIMTTKNDNFTQGNETGPDAGTKPTQHGTNSQGRENSSSFAASGTANGLDKAKETAGSFAEQAKSTASQAYNAVADKASTLVDDKKTELTSGLVGVAETVRKVSGVLKDGESPAGMNEYAARYAATAAKRLETAADYFERTDLKGMARDIETVARKNPAIFLGSAFALGILAARLFKSTPAAKEGGYDTHDLGRLPDSTSGRTPARQSSTIV